MEIGGLPTPGVVVVVIGTTVGGKGDVVPECSTFQLRESDDSDKG